LAKASADLSLLRRVRWGMMVGDNGYYCKKAS
jgi:hypothetical protein